MSKIARDMGRGVSLVIVACQSYAGPSLIEQTDAGSVETDEVPVEDAAIATGGDGAAPDLAGEDAAVSDAGELAGDDADGGPPAEVFPGTNIRFHPCIGVRPWVSGYSGGADWFLDLWTEFLEPREDAWRDDDPPTYLCVQKKFRWKDFYVDEDVAPSSADQARDPSWDNYAWNDVDIIAEILATEPITSGKAKLSILVADQATADAHSQPRWYADQGLTYGRESGECSRLDLAEGRRHVADFYVALQRKFGTEPGLMGIVLGEYFRGPSAYLPDDFDTDEYFRGRRFIWEQMAASAPLDDEGRRIAIYQTNPVLRSGVTGDDMVASGIGMSESDFAIFDEGCGESDDDRWCDPGTRSRLAQDAYYDRLFPTMINGDAARARRAVQYVWSGIDNPWGWRAGEEHAPTPQEIVWYHGDGGVVPQSSIFLKITGEGTFTIENWFDAFDRFGPGGSAAADWGRVPAILP